MQLFIATNVKCFNPFNIGLIVSIKIANNDKTVPCLTPAASEKQCETRPFHLIHVVHIFSHDSSTVSNLVGSLRSIILIYNT